MKTKSSVVQSHPPVGPKFTMFAWDFDGKFIFLNINNEHFINGKVRILGKRLCLTNLRDLAVLESV